jgi:hypothetical protein
VAAKPKATVKARAQAAHAQAAKRAGRSAR